MKKEMIKLNTDAPKPLSNKKSNKLIPKLEIMKKDYPLTAELLIEILKQYSEQFQLLEDWTIHTLYYRTWKNYINFSKSSWEWIENNLSKVKTNNSKEYDKLKKEIITEIGAKNSYEMFNNFWDYFVQFIAAVSLIEKGHKIISFPPSNEKSKSIDIISKKGDIRHYTECKFLKKSEKFENLFRTYLQNFFLFKNCLLFFAEFCSFPSGLEIKVINKEHINAIKNFILEILKNPKKQLIAYFTDKKGIDHELRYNAKLGMAKNLEDEEQQLKEKAENIFLKKTLPRIINVAKKQLDDAVKIDLKNKKISKKNKIRKNIFLGINPDNEYGISEFFEIGENKIKEILKDYKLEGYHVIFQILDI